MPGPGATFLEPKREHGWSRDENNNLVTYKRYDETLVYDADKPIWDLSDVAESGETISSATYTANNGLGVASTGEGNTTCYATITRTGSVEITATMSSGRIFQREFYFRSLDWEESDY